MRRRTAQFSAYDLLAVVAAQQAGLKLLTAEAAAEDEAARKLRDELVLQFESRLADEQTYTLADIHRWMAAKGCGPIGLTSLHRCRKNLREQLDRVAVSGRKATAIMEAIKDRPDGELTDAVSRLAQQLLFESLMNVPASGLSHMTNGEVLKMLETSGKLQDLIARRRLTDARLAEMQAKCKQAADAAADKTPDGRLGREDVYRILDAVMKGDAA